MAVLQAQNYEILNNKSGSIETSEPTREQAIEFKQHEAMSGQLGSSTANLGSDTGLNIKDGMVAHVLPSQSSSKEAFNKMTDREIQSRMTQQQKLKTLAENSGSDAEQSIQDANIEVYDQNSFGYQEEAQQFNQSEQLEPNESQGAGEEDSQDLQAFIQDLEAQKDQLLSINNEYIAQLDMKDTENSNLREELDSLNLQLQE